MKIKIIFLVFVVYSLALNAQVRQPGYIGDTLGPWSVITFDEPTTYVTINPAAQNLWAIGTPQKQFFNQAYTVPDAMVTGLSGYYPVNNQSSFDLSVGEFNATWNYLYDLFIDFRHKFDTDTLRDGGYISMSWDHRQTWMNILDDTLSKTHFWASPAHNIGWWGNTNLYTAADTLFNGEKGFSGRSNGWVHSCMAWYDLPVKSTTTFPPDTLFFRFNFISDNADHQKEGWMIDQISIFSLDLGSGIREFMAGKQSAFLTPNPLKTSMLVSLDRTFKQVDYTLADPSGRIAGRGLYENCREFHLLRNGLAAGIYLLKITYEGVSTEVYRVMVMD